MLSGSEVALLDGTLVGKTFRAFEEQLYALAAAQTANCIGITRQVVLLLDDRFTGLASPFVPDDIPIVDVTCYVSLTTNSHAALTNIFAAAGRDVARNVSTAYTRRRFGGRHPLCGIGVTSRMERTSI